MREERWSAPCPRATLVGYDSVNLPRRRGALAALHLPEPEPTDRQTSPILITFLCNRGGIEADLAGPALGSHGKVDEAEDAP
jgi:hypothetical protein